MELKESKTYLNLATAYTSECLAKTRYEFIEYGARKEGYKEMAQLIDNVVYNEFNHARMFYTRLQDAYNEPIKSIEITHCFPFKEKWNLLDNLKFAIEDEKEEVILYQKFSETAKKEGFKDISKLFSDIAKIENCHQNRFTTLYAQLKNNNMYKKEKENKWKCSACGYEQNDKNAPKTCPVCGEVQGAFMLILDDKKTKQLSKNIEQKNTKTTPKISQQKKSKTTSKIQRNMQVKN